MVSINKNWLKRRIESDPDVECEAGRLHPEAPLNVSPRTPEEKARDILSAYPDEVLPVEVRAALKADIACALQAGAAVQVPDEKLRELAYRTFPLGETYMLPICVADYLTEVQGFLRAMLSAAPQRGRNDTVDIFAFADMDIFYCVDCPFNLGRFN